MVWQAQAYLADDVVSHDDPEEEPASWIANTDIEAGDEPGVSAKWDRFPAAIGSGSSGTGPLRVWPRDVYPWVTPGWAWGDTVAVNPAADRLHATPINVDGERTYDRVSVVVDTSGTGVARLGLYADDAGAPGDLIEDFGTVDISSTGVKEVAIDVTLSGPYWLAFVTDDCRLLGVDDTTLLASPFYAGNTSARFTGAHYFGVGVNGHSAGSGLPATFPGPASAGLDATFCGVLTLREVAP